MCDYEKLGLFYLGRLRSDEQETGSEPYLYRSRDLVTHGVIMGMTGSGKTGLGIGLLEEAAIDGIPGLVVDPKGDLSNLLLTFPKMQPEDFQPWVSPEEADQLGIGVEELAVRQAQAWRQGLAAWDQKPERVNLLRDACDICVYTPGSTAGIPISILSSFAPPDEETMEDGELFGEMVQATVSGLLGLLGIQADPLQSREHLFLSALLQQAWTQGQELTLADIIMQVQKPPMRTIGVMDLDAFYPANERFSLAMGINSLLASPSFKNWIQGEPLNVQSLLYTPEGKPRLAIFSISHLSDAERMFFVTMLAQATLSWMRRQSGTGSLRALFYMDEVFGYLPPLGNPSSKKPLMIMLKQARAFGLGLVLATQNPADLDYKALANIGTWFVGRLQTERDRSKVKEGLMQALGEASQAKALEQALATLGKRVFMAITPGQQPLLFESRWTLSYLRGPLSRSELKSLQASRLSAAQTGRNRSNKAGTNSPNGLNSGNRTANQGGFGAGAPEGLNSLNGGSAAGGAVGVAAISGIETIEVPGLGTAQSRLPVLADSVPQCFLPAKEGAVAYRAVLLSLLQLHIENKKYDVCQDYERLLLVPVGNGPVSVIWDNAISINGSYSYLQAQPQEKMYFGELASGLADPKAIKSWRQSFVDWAYRNMALNLLECPELKLVSSVGESEVHFRQRLEQNARERRDDLLEVVRCKYAPKRQRLLAKLETSEQDLEQKNSEKGAGFLSVFVQNLTGSRSGFSTAKRCFKAHQRTLEKIEQIQTKMQGYREELAQLDAALRNEIASVEGLMAIPNGPLGQRSISPRRSDIDIRFFGIGWVPVDAQGQPCLGA